MRAGYDACSLIFVRSSRVGRTQSLIVARVGHEIRNSCSITLNNAVLKRIYLVTPEVKSKNLK